MRLTDWSGIGMPIGECGADEGLVITKPDGTGGLVSIATVSVETDALEHLVPVPLFPVAPSDVDPAQTVPLIQFA